MGVQVNSSYELRHHPDSLFSVFGERVGVPYDYSVKSKEITAVLFTCDSAYWKAIGAVK